MITNPVHDPPDQDELHPCTSFTQPVSSLRKRDQSPYPYYMRIVHAVGPKITFVSDPESKSWFTPATSKASDLIN